MPARVLHLLGSASHAGSGHTRIVGPLAAHLDADRYRTGACFLGGDGPLAEEMRAAGADVMVASWHGASSPLGSLRLWRALRGYAPALVHQHVGGHSLAPLVRSATHASIVAHLHGTESESARGNPVTTLSRGADEVVATSRAVADVAPRAARVVYPGAVVAQMPAARSGLIIGAASRLEPIKALDDLIRAAPRIVAALPAAKIEIAGTGSEHEALERAARDAGVADIVRFLGWQSDLSSCYRRWTVFVQPSLYEGFGIGALDAMAAGLPVIGTAVGGVPELVVHDRTGLLVAPRAPAALADAVVSLAAHPNRARVLGEAGRARVAAEFGVERMAREMAHVYDRALAGRKR